MAIHRGTIAEIIEAAEACGYALIETYRNERGDVIQDINVCIDEGKAVKKIMAILEAHGVKIE